MTSYYTGLCVGGSLDGQMQTNESPQLRVTPPPPSMPNLSCSWVQKQEPQFYEPKEADVYTHNAWIVRRGSKDVRFDLWVHHSLHLADAVAALHNAYQASRAQPRGTNRLTEG